MPNRIACNVSLSSSELLNLSSTEPFSISSLSLFFVSISFFICLILLSIDLPAQVYALEKLWPKSFDCRHFGVMPVMTAMLLHSLGDTEDETERTVHALALLTSLF